MLYIFVRRAVSAEIRIVDQALEDPVAAKPRRRAFISATTRQYQARSHGRRDQWKKGENSIGAVSKSDSWRRRSMCPTLFVVFRDSPMTLQLSLTVRDRETGKTINVSGRTIDKSGRAVVVKTKGLLEGREIVSASTEMRDAPTAADRKKAEILLLQLMSQVQIFDNPFIQTIWPGGESTDVIWPNPPPTSSTLPTIVTNLSINDSQQAAIEDMLTLDNSHRITIIQGPPGSGKTTVIAAYTDSLVEARRTGIWLIAQSNVAVKNIAEKLAKIGFEPWKLLVSQDFHFDWFDLLICLFFKY